MLEVLETGRVCMFAQVLSQKLQLVLAVTEAVEISDYTKLVKRKNYIPERNRLDCSLVIYCQCQWDVVRKVKKASTQYKSV